MLTAAFFVNDFASRDFVLHLENQTVRGVINLSYYWAPLGQVNSI